MVKSGNGRKRRREWGRQDREAMCRIEIKEGEREARRMEGRESKRGKNEAGQEVKMGGREG